jgi:hypothetical protein
MCRFLPVIVPFNAVFCRRKASRHVPEPKASYAAKKA